MRALLAAALALATTVSAHAQDAWTVAQRMSLPVSGAPIDLASMAAPHEETVRVRLSGTVSFTYDGSEIDAMGRTSNGTRDVTAGPFVVLPAGSSVIESDPVAHRYTVEIPRSSAMELRFNAFGLATANLLTISEAQAQFVSDIRTQDKAQGMMARMIGAEKARRIFYEVTT